MALIVTNSYAQKAKYHNEILLAMSQHVLWPNEADDENFVIGLLGCDDDWSSLQQLAQKKPSVLGKKLKIMRFNDPSDIQDCQVLYLSENCDVDEQMVLNSLYHKATLIVSAKEQSQVAMIHFIEKPDKLFFEINISLAKSHGLQFDEAIRKLAI